MSTEEWAKDLKEYINTLPLQHDDYKGLIEYINDALILLKEKDGIIEQYHKADTFLNAHGWKWE